MHGVPLRLELGDLRELGRPAFRLVAARLEQLREQMQYEIKHIHENLGVTVGYVTHDQSEAFALGDRVAIIRTNQSKSSAESCGPGEDSGWNWTPHTG